MTYSNLSAKFIFYCFGASVVHQIFVFKCNKLCYFQAIQLLQIRSPECFLAHFSRSLACAFYNSFALFISSFFRSSTVLGKTPIFLLANILFCQHHFGAYFVRIINSSSATIFTRFTSALSCIGCLV